MSETIETSVGTETKSKPIEPKSKPIEPKSEPIEPKSEPIEPKSEQEKKIIDLELQIDVLNRRNQTGSNAYWDLLENYKNLYEKYSTMESLALKAADLLEKPCPCKN